ncbi:hypothetical protein MKK58_06360 [Methylobacterium sp. J-078]|uniref:hypothetical protein n=1 Tax=Methylobacterium sp. J-078 TaxID=2836657 RepID=UPI001FB97E41|nr:hypothetical protein [Methylobacterium sp. J-078]MCJ2044154.1 hypothetical protein [Methylobacterium sp. J-078]
MSVRTKLPKELLKVVEHSQEALRDFVEEERGAFSEMSERWQEGDRAAEVSDWLDSLDEVVDALDCIRVTT